MIAPRDEIRVPVVEEELHVDRATAVTGKVRITTAVDHVEEIARLSLAEERVEVQRVPIGRDVESAPSVRTEGDTVIIPVLEEVMVVTKRLVLKEELHVRRLVTQETVEVPVTLRQERAVVERVGADRSVAPIEETGR